LDVDLLNTVFLPDFKLFGFLTKGLLTAVFFPEDFAIDFDPFLADFSGRFGETEETVDVFSLEVRLAVFLEYLIAIMY
jgi:hypothetical protein